MSARVVTVQCALLVCIASCGGKTVGADDFGAGDAGSDFSDATVQTTDDDASSAAGNSTPDASEQETGGSEEDASGDETDSSTDAMDAGAFDASAPIDADGPHDAGNLDDGGPADAALDGHEDGGCLTWGLGGIGVPAGTLTSADSTYMTYTPDKAIDGDLATDWNAATFTASIRLRFPMAMSIAGIRVASRATPPTSETYTITTSGVSGPIGSAAFSVGSSTTINAVAITPGTYADITVTVAGTASWAAIAEISLLTNVCK